MMEATLTKRDEALDQGGVLCPGRPGDADAAGALVLLARLGGDKQASRRDLHPRLHDRAAQRRGSWRLARSPEAPLIAMENTPNLLWAGDLDRDGRLDLLFRTPIGGYSKRYVLFLSSTAAPPDLLKAVASFGVLDC